MTIDLEAIRARDAASVFYPETLVAVHDRRALLAYVDELRERLAEAEKDAARLDWLEEGMVSYGDGYTEPRECGVTFQWQQSVGCPTFPGLRAAIDVAMQETAP